MKKIMLLTAQVFLLLAFLVFTANFSLAQRISNHSIKSNLTVNADYPSNVRIEAYERQVFDLINRERVRNGLSALAWNGELAQLARSYSQKMADRNFFSHYESDGADVVQRARGANIKQWHKIGENLFECENVRNYSPLAVQAWMKSPGHRRNILDSQFSASGIGIAQSANGKIYITQVFIGK